MRYTTYIHLLLQCVFKNRIWGNCVCIYIYIYIHWRISQTDSHNSKITGHLDYYQKPILELFYWMGYKSNPQEIMGKKHLHEIKKHPVLVSICLASFLGVAAHQPPETRCLDRFAAAAQHSRRRYRFGPRQAGLPQHKLHIGIYPSKSEWIIRVCFYHMGWSHLTFQTMLAFSLKIWREKHQNSSMK